MTLDVTGDRMDDTIIRHLRKEHGIEIGHLIAERIKLETSSACELEEDLSLVVRGRHVESNLPAETYNNSVEIRVALKPCVDAIVRGILDGWSARSRSCRATSRRKGSP